MDETVAVRGGEKPMWRKIVDYPLVTMVIAVFLFILAITIAGVIAKFLPAMGPTGDAVVHTSLAVALLLLVYKLAIVRLGRFPKDDLPAAGALRDTGIGLAIGIGIMALAVGVAAALGIYRITGPGDASRLVIELFTVAIFPGFNEELLFRGILFRWLEEFGGSWLALAVTSGLFGLAHILNPNATWFSSFAIAVEAGVLLGGAYMLTRNLWLAMGLHAAWNFTQGEIFDVPVSGLDEHGLVQAKLSGPELLSGGQFGLEASIIALTIATATGVLLVYLAIKRGHLVRPSWLRPSEPPLAEPVR